MIAATKGSDNLAWEFSDKQEIVNMMPHCIFQQVMASLAHFPMFLHPLIKTWEGFSLIFSNLSIKFVFLFLPYVEIFLSIILFIFFITQIIICYIFW